MRLVHLSDIHVGCMALDAAGLFDKRVFGLLNYSLRRREKIKPAYLTLAVAYIRSLQPDVVIITGDLTCVGAPAEFELVRRQLEPLVGLPGCDVLYVPGNHDAYVRNRACQEALEACFWHLNQGRWHLSQLPQELCYPKLRLLAVNECQPTAVWSSSGRIDAASWPQVEAWLNRPREEREKRIRVGHFPVADADGRPLGWRRRLQQAPLLSQALEAGRCDISLCGHIHTPFLRPVPGQAGGVEICAGALSYFGRLNVLDFSPHSGAFSQHWVDIGKPAAPPSLPVALPWIPATHGAVTVEFAGGRTAPVKMAGDAVSTAGNQSSE